MPGLRGVEQRRSDDGQTLADPFVSSPSATVSAIPSAHLSMVLIVAGFQLSRIVTADRRAFSVGNPRRRSHATAGRSRGGDVPVTLAE
jgi:hypothetical protein